MTSAWHVRGPEGWLRGARRCRFLWPRAHPAKIKRKLAGPRGCMDRSPSSMSNRRAISGTRDETRLPGSSATTERTKRRPTRSSSRRVMTSNRTMTRRGRRGGTRAEEHDHHLRSMMGRMSHQNSQDQAMEQQQSRRSCDTCGRATAARCQRQAGQGMELRP